MKKHAENDSEQKTAGEAGPMAPSSGATEAAPEQVSPQAEPTKPGSADETVQKTVEPAKNDEIKARMAELEKLNADLNDQYLRKAAEFDNYRKRMLKEKQEAIDFANTNLLVDLVQILDDFDRAMTAGGEQESGSPAAAFADGITMIRRQLGSMLENKYGLAYFPAKGEHFDPNIHQAIGTAESTDVQEPTVAEEFVKGYKLKDRVIRVAKVMVSMPVENSKQ